ncbi:hypothetical protein WICPIJ_004589 [Wickerhamomyces pijperi]|uniref:Uncharacterized protein n=1 Tax=Wickerhamomyces pijperi TaxID=599730 RepID=A0A9P8Q7B6_WICPI|nr:hypothetical protein WICPIJ_004589 [Wickerhamomyces pijperi]
MIFPALSSVILFLLSLVTLSSAGLIQWSPHESLNCQHLITDFPLELYINKTQETDIYQSNLNLLHTDLVFFKLANVVPADWVFNDTVQALNETLNADFDKQLLTVTVEKTDVTSFDFSNENAITNYTKNIRSDRLYNNHLKYEVPSSGFYCVYMKHSMEFNETLSIEYTRYNKIGEMSWNETLYDTYTYNATDGEYYSALGLIRADMHESYYKAIQFLIKPVLYMHTENIGTKQYTQHIFNRLLMFAIAFFPCSMLLGAALYVSNLHFPGYSRHVHTGNALQWFGLLTLLTVFREIITLLQLSVIQSTTPIMGPTLDTFRLFRDDSLGFLLFILMILAEGSFFAIAVTRHGYSVTCSVKEGNQEKYRRVETNCCFPLTYRKDENNVRTFIFGLHAAIKIFFFHFILFVYVFSYVGRVSPLIPGTDEVSQSFQGYLKFIGGLIAILCIVVLIWLWKIAHENTDPPLPLNAIDRSIEEIQLQHRLRYRIWIGCVCISFLGFYFLFLNLMENFHIGQTITERDAGIISWGSLLYSGIDILFYSWCILLVIIIWSKDILSAVLTAIYR